MFQKEKPFNEMSLEELIKKQKKLKIVNGLLGFFLVILIIGSIYLSMNLGFGIYSITPVLLLIIFVTNLDILKKIKAEIAAKDHFNNA